MAKPSTQHAKHSSQPHATSGKRAAGKSAVKQKAPVKPKASAPAIRPAPTQQAAQPPVQLSHYTVASSRHLEPTPDQQAALLQLKAKAAESNRYVYQRAKSLVLAGAVAAGIALYTFFSAITSTNAAGPNFLMLGISLVALGISFYLFYARDVQLVATALKIFMIAQAFNILSSVAFFDYTVTSFNIFVIVFLIYVHARVKTLDY